MYCRRRRSLGLPASHTSDNDGILRLVGATTTTYLLTSNTRTKQHPHWIEVYLLCTWRNDKRTIHTIIVGIELVNNVPTYTMSGRMIMIMIGSQY